MTQRLMHVTGLIIALTLLLATVVGTGHARQARLAETRTIVTLSDDAEGEKDTALVCLMLIGGIALLAGTIWMDKVR